MFTIRAYEPADEAGWLRCRLLSFFGSAFYDAVERKKERYRQPAIELVAEEDGEIVGTYYIRANQQGGGAHVANCGYMTAAGSTGKGIARRMCEHSLQHARARGFKAMQFNFVVSSNERAVRLWQSLGFETVGRLPRAFEHPRHGFVDALVMFRAL